MKTAKYSLITMRPSLERLDVLCVGVAVLDDGEWLVLTVPDSRKFLSLDPNFDFSTISAFASTLNRFLEHCETLSDARQLLASSRSSISIHDFEGVFGYETEQEFDAQIHALMAESVLPIGASPRPSIARKKAKPRIRSQLRRQFQTMGLLGKTHDDINSRKVIPNFPVSAAHGLVAEFAIKNGVMSFTETLDFAVSEDGVRNRIFEAQAKCLVMKTAVETFGTNISRHIVIAGGGSPKASRSVDLLSTVGELYALESSADMAKYFGAIEHSAHHIG
ncbi:hypothetical protein ACEN8I_15065 [Polaromonas sp. CT11-55]|uniref:hypothetical protein n=1 Tax=Polaromonas sp. CT11-55 TaxID=3243045 RepID=UPI0039A70B7D